MSLWASALAFSTSDPIQYLIYLSKTYSLSQMGPCSLMALACFYHTLSHHLELS